MPLVPVKENPPAAGSAFEVHLNMGAIQGESSSTAHRNEIELLSFCWGGTNSPIRTVGSGSTKGGVPSISEVTVTKGVDKSSTQLWNALISGQIIKCATITWSKSTGGKKPEDYLTITLTNAIVTSVQLSSGGGKGIGTESVTIAFDKVTMDYKVQGLDGLLTSAGQMNYDLALGKAN